MSRVAASQTLIAARRVHAARRQAGAIWALLFVNGLTFSGVQGLVPVPSQAIKLVTEAALAVALVWALLVNRDRVVRPNWYLGLLSILALSALVTSARLNTGVGSLVRDLRFMAFVAVLYLLTPFWGDPDLPLARWHVRCLAVFSGTVLLGLAIDPGAALLGGRLSGIVWPSPPTQVAHYAAVLAGMVVVAWLSGILRTSIALPAAGCGLAMVLLTGTRTAMVGLVVGMTAAMLSLVTVRRRARRAVVALLIAGALAAVPLGGVVSDWFARGQSSAELSGLTGRADTWDRIIHQPRSHLERWLGSGLSNKSFEGLPIDNSWLAIYQDEGLVGDVIVAAILVVLLVTSLRRPRGPASALALFLVCYCSIASYTETGLGDASPYLLDLSVAASLLVPPALAPVSTARARASESEEEGQTA